ncbi:glycosyltransferase family 4 protein [Candidatus Peregrinibacteria bacterium]|nr:glycosyltransferase family 4 protein [Candidatus Peregrinibacteria bacterium]
MRIGIDCRMYSSSFTGIGRYVFELVRHLGIIEKTLPKEEQNQYVLFFNDPEYDLFQAVPPYFTKIHVNAHHYSFSEQTKFLRLLHDAKLDLMHFTHFNAPIFYKKPCVVTIHDLILSFYPGKKMTKPWHRWGYNLTLSSIVKKARSIIAVSENTKLDLLKLFRLPESKIRIIYEGVGEEFRMLPEKDAQEARSKYDLNKPFLFYAGVWRNHKNLVNLIRAFHSLRTSYHHDILLVLTGREDSAYPEVKATVRELSLENFVRFPGLVNEKNLVQLYNAAAIYVQPSFYEGFGLNILEAFACGTPVASSNRSCLPEIAGDGNARFFNPDNYRDIANTIHYMLENEKLLSTLKERGKIRVKDFSWKIMAEEIRRLYTR